MDATVLNWMKAALDFLGASTQWVVAGSVGAALLTTTDSKTFTWVVGSLVNAVFSKVLKKGINQVRYDKFGFALDHVSDVFFLPACRMSIVLILCFVGNGKHLLT